MVILNKSYLSLFETMADAVERIVKNYQSDFIDDREAILNFRRSGFKGYLLWTVRTNGTWLDIVNGQVLDKIDTYKKNYSKVYFYLIDMTGYIPRIKRVYNPNVENKIKKLEK